MGRKPKQLIRIADDLSLPLSAVQYKFGFIGTSGGGKTYAAQKMAEQLLRVHCQTVVLDPVGKWYSLRMARDGRTPSEFDLPVFGGLYGDLPLEPTSGALIADVIVDRGISAVIDVSQFETDADQSRFARDFGRRLYFRKKEQMQPTAMFLFLEECQEFIPQNLPPGDQFASTMMHVYTRLWKLGRNFGINGALISQRPQEVNKKVLNLTECMFAFRMTGPQEKKTIQDWISDKAIKDEEDVRQMLPKLKTGFARLWSPSWLEMNATIHFSEKETFDASATPKLGAKAKKPRPLRPIDISKLKDVMAAAVEKAEQTDPTKLQKRVAELTVDLTKASRELEQLRARPPVARAGKPAKVVTQTVVMFKAKDRTRIEKALKDFDRSIIDLRELETRLPTVMKAATDSVNMAAKSMSVQVKTLHENLTRALSFQPRTQQSPQAAGISASSPPKPRDTQLAPRAATVGIPTNENSRSISDVPNGELSKGERLVLGALIQFPDGLHRSQLTVLLGYKQQTRDAYIKRLGAKGYVENLGGGNVRATPEGIAALPDFEPLPTGPALLEYWRRNLPSGEWKVLEIAVNAHPESIDRNSVSEITGFTQQTRDAYVKRLVARQLLTLPERGSIKASDYLF